MFLGKIACCGRIETLVVTASDVLNSLEAHVIALDSQGRVQVANRYSANSVGMSVAELRGQDWIQFCDMGASGVPVRAEFVALIRSSEGSSASFDWALRSKEGRVEGIVWRGTSTAEGAVLVGQVPSRVVLPKEALSAIRHQLRTPLSAILGFSELLEQESIGPEQQQYYLSNIRESARQLRRLIDELHAEPRDAVKAPKASSPPPRARAAIVRPAAEYHSAGTVLVVDDVETNLVVARGYLEGAGYRVLLARSGEQALEIYARESVQVVLLDLMMPGMDGFETCRRLRCLPGGSVVPIVFLTAAKDFDSHRRAFDEGADDYLTKPFEGIELLLRVKSLVRIRRLIADLRAHRDALLVAREERRRLTNMIVHDLKGPIQAVMGYAELLKVQRHDDPETQKFSRHILAAGERLDEMVLDVLNSESSEGGGFVAQRALADLQPFLLGILEELASQAATSGHTLQLECPAPEVAYYDEALLRRVIENLVRNALEHTPPGEVKVLVRRLGSSHGVEVVDQGEGIPFEDRERIFDCEVSLSASAGQRNQGLGLAFCRLALEAHASRIWVEDNPGGGSRFCFRLPGLDGAVPDEVRA